jgi:anhydro-N-acetylmuramic acid kinase
MTKGTNILQHPAERDARLAAGLMSGTSVDGVDAALVRLSGPPDEPRVRLLGFVTLPYPPEVRQCIMRVAAGEQTTAGEVSQLNFLLGELFAKAALRVCRLAHVPPRRVSVIGSHGQTIYHQGRPEVIPSHGEAAGPNTLQIAEPAVIAERTGAPVVADFRTADVAAGGQGAPLVPMVDYLLLRDRQKGTVALNIGGIANVTVLQADAKPLDVFGFDTGPGNMVTDALVQHFTGGREYYDAGGRVAARGKVIEPLLADALCHPFFLQPPPKSAGREQFGHAFVEPYFLPHPSFPSPVGEGSKGWGRARFEDLLRTSVELTARTIAGALARFVFPEEKIDRLIVSGGGAHNRLLLKCLPELLPRLTVELSDRYGLPVDAKEAIAFAILADRTLHGLPGNLPSVTGARRAVVLGKIVQP